MSDASVFDSATRLAQRLRDKEVSSVELTNAFIEQIERHDAGINAVVVRRFEQALDEARRRGRRVGPGRYSRPIARRTHDH